MFSIGVILSVDNSVVEAAYDKGNSSSKALFDLVVELKILEFHSESVFHIIHVSGKIMIAQGTDGVSRGDLTEGVMSGKSMISQIPINSSAFERSSDLKDWLLKVTGEPLKFLETKEWFTRGHDH